MLVRVVTRGVHLVRVVLGHPHVLGRELRALYRIGVRLIEGKHVLARHQLVGDRLTDSIALVGIGHFPVAGGKRVDHALGFGLALELCLLDHPGIPVRVVVAGGQRLAVALVNRVLRAVHHHVEADAEEVLVMGSINAGRNQVAVLGLDAFGDGAVGHDAGHLYLVADAAVLVEVPEVSVLVVADRGDGREHQAA